MNLIGIPEELLKIAKYLKREFEMKDLGKIKYCLGLQIEQKIQVFLIMLMQDTSLTLTRHVCRHGIFLPIIIL